MIRGMISLSSMRRNGAASASVVRDRMKRMYRARSVANVLKMGHCAPSVMQTNLDLGKSKKEWLPVYQGGLGIPGANAVG